MVGVRALFAMLIMAGTPELPGRGTEAPARGKPAAAKPIASAVDLGSKWGVVTSVRRSPERNRAVGGAPNSFHLFGRAIDIARRPGVRHSEIDAAYRKAGYRLIESLDEGDHSHFAFGTVGAGARPDLPKPQQFASNEAAPACASPKDTALMGRRRPDRSDGCESPEPAPRLKPLEPAE